MTGIRNILMTLFSKIKSFFFRKKYAVGFLPPQYKNIEAGNLCFGHSRGNYEVPRDQREEAFYSFLQNNGFDSYGHRTDTKVSETFQSYKNDTFCIRPYYWGDDPKIYHLPNFEYYPTDLEISWYKYPFRDSYSNRTFSVEEFKEILAKCEESMRVTDELRQ